MTAKVVHYSDVPAEAVPDVTGVTVRWAIRADDGAPHFAMRIFEVQPGCGTPLHRHWWEHEVFVLDGAGILRTEQGEKSLRPGTVVFVPGQDLHQFCNSGSALLRFICLVPHPQLEGWARSK